MSPSIACSLAKGCHGIRLHVIISYKWIFNTALHEISWKIDISDTVTWNIFDAKIVPFHLQYIMHVIKSYYFSNIKVCVVKVQPLCAIRRQRWLTTPDEQVALVSYQVVGRIFVEIVKAKDIESKSRGAKQQAVNSLSQQTTGSTFLSLNDRVWETIRNQVYAWLNTPDLETRDST